MATSSPTWAPTRSWAATASTRRPTGRRLTPSYSLDGVDNDGAAGEKDLIGTDVENIAASADIDAQTVTITGDGRGNRLTVQAGKGVITGGEGTDVLEGASQDDMLNARDGSPDTVICNGGTDTVLADTLDIVSPSCENVQIQATPGGRSTTARRRSRGPRLAPASHRGQRADDARGQRGRRPRAHARCSSSTTTAWSARTRQRRTRANTSRAAATSAVTR